MRRLSSLVAATAALLLVPATAQAAIVVGPPVLVTVSATGVPANFGSQDPSISDNGALVAFASAATTLGPNAPSGGIYVKNLRTGGVTLASRTSTGAPVGVPLGDPDLSGPGTRVIWTTSGALVPQDTNARIDVYLRDLTARTTRLVTVDSAGGPINGDVSTASISGDGRFVAFSTLASDVVAGDTNGAGDAFLRDLTTGVTQRVSVRTGGGQSSGQTFQASVSRDGRYVAFVSSGQDLVPGQDADGGLDDVFVRDRVAGTTTWVSRGAGAAGVLTAAISPDGRTVVQRLDGSGRLLVTTVATGASTLLGAGTISRHPFTADSHFLTFSILNRTRAVVRDLVTGTQRPLSRRVGTGLVTGEVQEPVITPDGRFAVLVTDAEDVGLPGAPFAPDVYRYPLTLT